LTGLQYKNTIAKALNELSVTNNSIAVAKEILNSCGAEFPYVELEGILRTFSSDEFTCWRTCTYDDAQKFANEGVPVVGVSSESIYVIEPEDSALSGEDVVDAPDNASGFIRQTSLMSLDECADMKFFAYSGTPITILPATSGTISDVPLSLVRDGFDGWYNPVCSNKGVRKRVPRFVQIDSGSCLAYSIMMGSHCLNHSTVDPTTFFNDRYKNGYINSNGGAIWDSFTDIQNNNHVTMVNQLNLGRPVVVLGRTNKSGVTNYDHFVLVVAYSGNGNCDGHFIVIDPLSSRSSPKTFAEFKANFPNDTVQFLGNSYPMFIFK
jgi:hypothetical protein